MRILKKDSIRKIAVSIIIAMLLISSSILVISNIGTTHAEGLENLDSLCAEYTKSVYGYFDNAKKITDYENYVDNRFQVGTKYNNKNYQKDTTDEWIMEFVPQRLFEEKAENFLYIGKKYGFYIDYDETNGTFLMYLMLHDINTDKSGHLERKIEPLFYERYVYVEEWQKPQLVYCEMSSPVSGGMSVKTFFFDKYSDMNKVYLKDITFTGHLFNENHENDGDKSYIANEDNGAYFIGGSYMFKGVSTSSAFDFVANVAKIGLGYIKLGNNFSVGDALNVIDVVTAAADFAESATHDFRNQVTNEKDNYFYMTDISASEQISKYGRLIKNYIGELKTPSNKKGVLYGIRGGCYAKSTAYYNSADDRARYDSLFTGRVEMDIVKQELLETTKVTTVQSNKISHFIAGNEVRTIEEGSTENIYAVRESDIDMQFVAPYNGDYTFETFGSIKNQFDAGKGVITNKSDGHNQSLKVYLKKGETFNFSTSYKANEVGRYQLSAKFTPTQIAVGDIKSIEVQPNETEYFVFDYVGEQPITIRLNSDQLINMSLNKHIPMGESVKSLEDERIMTSYYDYLSGKYYFSVTNKDVVNRGVVTLDLSQVEEVEAGQTINPEIIDNVIYKFNADIGSNYNITAHTLSTIQIKLYNRNMDEMFYSDSSRNHNFDFTFEQNEVYYIELSNMTLGRNGVDFNMVYSPERLIFGNNNIDKPVGEYLYRYHTTAKAKYTVNAGGANISIYNTSGAKLNIGNGAYELEDDTDYYFVVDGTTANISVGFESTDSMSGKLSANGYVYVRFVPDLSYNYTVTTNLSYKLYDENLFETNSHDMIAGNTYYIMLSGNANQDYAVEMDIDAVELNTYVYQNIDAGYYVLNVSNIDEYAFNIYKENNSNISIRYGSNSLDITNEVNDGYKTILMPGKYYFEVEGTSYVTLIIQTKNASAADKIDLTLGQSVGIDVYTNGVYNFEYINHSGTQTYRISKTNIRAITWEITVFRKDTNTRVDVIVNDSSNDYYEFTLEHGAYVISLYCTSAPGIVNLNIELYIPNKLSGYVVNGKTYSLTESLNLRMGVNYTLSPIGRTGATHGIRSWINNANATLIDGNMEFVMQENPYSVTLHLSDDDGAYEIMVYLVFPYKLTASLNDYYYSVQISTYDSETPKPYTFKNVSIRTTSQLVMSSNSKSVDLAGSLIFGDSQQLSGVVDVEIDGRAYLIDMNNVMFYNNARKLSSINGNESSRLFIEATQATNKTINIGTNVRAILLIGALNVTHNVKFVFPATNSKTITLYTKNFNNTSDKSGAFIGASANVKWINEGVSTIKANGAYAVELNRLELGQNGTYTSNITVQGSDKGNASKGTSGMYLHDTLVTATYGGSITIIGGTGAEGTNGTSQSQAAGRPNPGADGMNGAKGGNGTAGYNGGHGLIVVNNFALNNASIICIGGNGGKGGNGGNGGKGGWANSGHDSGGVYKATKGGNGGNGGAGGNGARGGSGGNALVIEKLSNANNYSKVSCTAGTGGKGGNGSNGADASSGAKGGDDHNPWTDKGDCHCGGSGGKGGDSGQAAYGGYNGLTITNKVTSSDTSRGANGDFGLRGVGGGIGACGDAGAGGSPEGCQKGNHFTPQYGAWGIVNQTYC